MSVKAYAVTKEKGDFEPHAFELGDLAPYEVDIHVESCGICHSDLSMVDNEWGMTQYPLVPGHEVVGRVSALGEHVTHVEVGDRVGLGWHSGYCMTCDQCMGGDHNLCASAEPTIAGRHGGFAETVRAKAPSVIKIPEALDAQEVGPLLCGGIAVFNPMVQVGLSPTHSVGVIGIGGLGHLGLKFAAAWGCHVTAFTSESKQQEARDMGAHETINSRDPEAIKAAVNRFDLVLSTVNVPMDWNAVLGTLKPRGRLMLPGAVTDPLDINLLPDMMFKQLAVSSTAVGAPVVMRQMLEFAARHQITSVNEHFPMSKVNDAFEHLRSGKVRYRIVLDRD